MDTDIENVSLSNGYAEKGFNLILESDQKVVFLRSTNLRRVILGLIDVEGTRDDGDSGLFIFSPWLEPVLRPESRRKAETIAIFRGTVKSFQQSLTPR